jgi:hypothetical protein
MASSIVSWKNENPTIVVSSPLELFVQTLGDRERQTEGGLLD